MSNITKFFTKHLGPKVIHNFLTGQDSEKLGEEIYDVLDELADKEFGDKESDKIVLEIIMFLRGIAMGINKKRNETKGIIVNKNN